MAFRCIWLYFGRIWQCVIVFGRMLLVFNRIWPYLAVFGHIQKLLAPTVSKIPLRSASWLCFLNDFRRIGILARHFAHRLFCQLTSRSHVSKGYGPIAMLFCVSMVKGFCFGQSELIQFRVHDLRRDAVECLSRLAESSANSAKIYSLILGVAEP